MHLWHRLVSSKTMAQAGQSEMELRQGHILNRDFTRSARQRGGVYVRLYRDGGDHQKGLVRSDNMTIGSQETQTLKSSVRPHCPSSKRVPELRQGTQEDTDNEQKPKSNEKYWILILQRHVTLFMFWSSEKAFWICSDLALIVLYIRYILCILFDCHLNQVVSYLRENKACPIYSYIHSFQLSFR